MKEVATLKDINGLSLYQNSPVIAEDGQIQGKVTALYDNNSVDIHHANAHQGPVIDSFDIISKEV